MSVSELGDCGLFEVTSSKCRWWAQSRDGHTCPVSPCLAQIRASGTCSQHSWHLCLWFLWIQHSWASIPGVRTPLACTCHIRVPQTHIPCILVPLVHKRVIFYSSPAILEFRVLLVVVKVRGGWVVIVVVVIKVIRLMGTATVIVTIWLLGTTTFVVPISSSISVVVVHSTTFWGWGSRFEPQVQVWLLLESEPAKRFGFRYSSEPDTWTPGSKSGSNRVQKVQELNCGQSNPPCTLWCSQVEDIDTNDVLSISASDTIDESSQIANNHGNLSITLSAPMRNSQTSSRPMTSWKDKFETISLVDTSQEASKEGYEG